MSMPEAEYCAKYPNDRTNCGTSWLILGGLEWFSEFSDAKSLLKLGMILCILIVVILSISRVYREVRRH